jgi:hybrid cluster-associated redox disulfide protein
MAKVTKEMMIGELLQIDADAVAPVLFDIGMHCLGCPASRGETVEQACMVHGVNVDELLAQVNKLVAQ